MSAVSYLNTVPLVWGMLHGAQKGLFDLTFDIPADCARRLGANEADIGIVPVAALAELGLDVLPGAGIAAYGPVRSILLISKVPVKEIRTLSLDTSSRTSVKLVRIILRDRYGVTPRCVSMPPDLPAMLAEADAALVIGDPALHIDPRQAPHTALDLSEEWLEMTGLPMVFAVWAGRPGTVTPEIEQAFRDSARFGVEHIEDIVVCESEPRGFSQEFVREYFAHNIINELTEREYAGLRRFLELAGTLE
ncbi:MAG: menaquinone biosynthesis protein [Bryobacteraceae bacterium]